MGPPFLLGGCLLCGTKLPFSVVAPKSALPEAHYLSIASPIIASGR